MEQPTTHLRARWAALGAIVAIVVGAGGFGIVGATIDQGERASLVPIEPCRLADTRPAPDTVGPRSTPLGPGEAYTFMARGTHGNCTIPTGATGLVLDVTAVGATEQTNLRVYPAGATQPVTANLNPSPGAPPTPNAVTTGLSGSGELTIANHAGSVHVIVDVAGYYEDHIHDDRYLSETIVGPGVNASFFTFTPQATHAGVDQTVTTTRPGRLLITLYARVTRTCTPDADSFRAFYLVIDDEAVESSVLATFSNDTLEHTFVGVTDGVIAAGSHDIEVGVECVSPNTTAAGTTTNFTYATVTVLP